MQRYYVIYLFHASAPERKSVWKSHGG